MVAALVNSIGGRRVDWNKQNARHLERHGEEQVHRLEPEVVVVGADYPNRRQWQRGGRDGFWSRRSTLVRRCFGWFHKIRGVWCHADVVKGGQELKENRVGRLWRVGHHKERAVPNTVGVCVHLKRFSNRGGRRVSQDRFGVVRNIVQHAK